MNEMFDRILLQDCLSGMRDLPQDCADVCIADPPYNIGKDFGETHDDNLSLHDYTAWCRQWIVESLRVLKPGGLLYVYGFAEILARVAVEFPLECQHFLVWHYKNKAVPSSQFWQRSHESILCLWQGARPRLNIDAIREPYSESFLKNAAGKTRKQTHGRFSRGDKTTIYKAHEQGALPRDVISIPALAGGAGRSERWFYCKDCQNAYPPEAAPEHRRHDIVKHPTQKPEALTRRLLLSCAEAGDAVLVPFTGSGSECVTARKLSIRYLGFETNPDYWQLATRRLEAGGK